MNFSTGLRQLILYFIVGAGATIVEWGVFYFLDCMCKIHYMIATPLAFILSTLANWYFGRLLLFHKGDTKGLVHEFLAIYGVSCIGLLANLAIMFVCISGLHIVDIIAKIIATGFVFIGNFIVRKYWIYQ